MYKINEENEMREKKEYDEKWALLHIFAKHGCSSSLMNKYINSFPISFINLIANFFYRYIYYSFYFSFLYFILLAYLRFKFHHPLLPQNFDNDDVDNCINLKYKFRYFSRQMKILILLLFIFFSFYIF